jgi:hypothetical protein
MNNTSWLDLLDDEGKQLYNDYITATKKWVQYISPKADANFNTYINTTKKLYNKYSYLTEQYLQISENINCTSSIQSKDLTAKYKKLSLLFHPDKYHNANNSKMFILIHQFYSNNNEIIINIIDTISHIILDTENIDNLVTNLENSNITEILESYDKNNHTELFRLLNNPNLIANTSDSKETKTISDDIYTEYIFSENYKFYKQCKQTKKYIDSAYITEDEFITLIKETPYYNEDFIKYCINLYSNIPNIFSAISEWYKKENERLRQEKTTMEEKIKKTNEFITRHKNNTT